MPICARDANAHWGIGKFLFPNEPRDDNSDSLVHWTHALIGIHSCIYIYIYTKDFMPESQAVCMAAELLPMVPW